ncbi:Cleft lip and palate transmembrane protein 1-like protein [Eumeta japonica]|uniref:Lipid scramblase CLPTM1L n=1 Tax=Eumeta variegata TaxID=151549 RepID=A0A4C1YNW7_EUMVA|nr:Cleft lip and palate transmembrane protein 1-like protein [Eumeta japonica]
MVYYGLANRRHSDSIEYMKYVIWATFFHYSSTDENPHHIKCTSGADSWCEWQKVVAANAAFSFVRSNIHIIGNKTFKVTATTRKIYEIEGEDTVNEPTVQHLLSLLNSRDLTLVDCSNSGRPPIWDIEARKKAVESDLVPVFSIYETVVDLLKDVEELRRSESIHTLPLTTYTEPQVATFNLLNQQAEDRKTGSIDVKPYSHISTFVPLSILTDDLNLPANKIPGELYPYIRLRGNRFLPIVQHNALKSRLSNLQLLNSSTNVVNLTIAVAPTSYGSLRLALHVRLALQHLRSLGFSEKDVDDVKGIFADTNLYLLSATVLIASFHLLFDFLAFKNDVSFWRRKRSLAGLSARTVFWRAFSQLVIFLYLLDEQTSLLVLAPAGISAVIELWKVTKVLHLRVGISGWRLRVWRERGPDAGERTTARADAEAMRYLSMLLYPLCVAGAVYSLVYEPHKSWYSWALHSVVNGVYAFGFLFMLPQLFVNYRLRSVAALPWRAFMYKAFNTFIDDVFAFIITMPMAHRVACFRDDLVFLVYLYQRWLYPVDKTRTDTAVSMDENPEDAGVEKLKEE